MADNLPDGIEAGREALRRFLAGDDDLDTMFQTVIEVAVASVPGCDSASVTVIQRDRPATPVYTDDTALRLDLVQYEIGDGPCLAAIRHHGPEHCPAEGDGRWAEYRDEAERLGVLATLSTPFVHNDRALGAFNLYSQTRGSYDADAQAQACRFADQVGVAAANAAVLVEGVRMAEQLQMAMESRAVIEQAKGILMAAERCGPDEAFDILRQASQHQNRKLRDVAAEIVERYASGSADHA